MKAMIAVALFVVTALGATTSAQAAFLFETAAGSPLLTALVLDDFFWPAHRFQIGPITMLASVGGFFESLATKDQTIFAAVVALSGPLDFPDSLDLSTPDVVGTTLIDVARSVDGVDRSASLNIALAPGWYALVFGAGKFGADTGVTEIGMPSLTIDLAPLQFPFTAIQSGNPFGTPPQFVNQAVTPRFFATTPEPATIALLGLGLAGLVASRRHNLTDRGNSTTPTPPARRWITSASELMLKVEKIPLTD